VSANLVVALDACYLGDVRDGLRAYIAAGVRAQTCITSPPYWGLRDYGMTGQLGLEPTPAEYVANMVEVFRLVRDVLADDGTLWLNIGDSYTGNGSPGGESSRTCASPPNARDKVPTKRGEGLKAKDLVGIPWRLAFALQADGWYLRSDIIWHKPNPMPESVTDRPTKAHEYLFLLAKRERYYYDAAAIAEPATTCLPIVDKETRSRNRLEATSSERQGKDAYGSIGYSGDGTARNRRTVWTVATQPYSEAHFATFPTALVEPCILAGTSARGHCPACGKGWERMVEKPDFGQQPKRATSKDGHMRNGDRTSAGQAWQEWRAANPDRHLGWQPTCECGGAPAPGVVLDPFMGSGTVAQVAQSLGRRWIGCELNPDYHALQKVRAAQLGMAFSAPDVNNNSAADVAPLVPVATQTGFDL
jgi:DNA modification methylase